MGRVGPHSINSGRGAPSLEQLQKLAALAVAAPSDVVDLAEPQPWRVARRLNDEVVAEIVAKYESGVGTPALCLEYGISKPSMLELLHSRGVQMRRQSLTDAQRSEAVALYEGGLALAPTAKCLGSSIGAVRRVVLEQGVRLRARPGR